VNQKKVTLRLKRKRLRKKVEQRGLHELDTNDHADQNLRAEDRVTMQVLIVEDDAALGLFLQKGLKLEGHDVEWLADGEAALERLQSARPDLMVLDLSLPRKDGTEILQSLAGRFDGMAVLVLTGRNEVEIRVKCLNMGADDCMLKPFSFHELRARCRALLRRREQFADPVLRQSGIELHRLERRVTRDGTQVDLTVKEFALLEFLLRRRGKCCSRAELLREVWQMSPDTGTNVVDVYINYLRRKLGAAHPLDKLAGGAPELIETVRGAGYMLRDGTSLPPAAMGRKGVQRATIQPAAAQPAAVQHAAMIDALGVRKGA
jgi:DNA-binding response OmpR family regulator